MGELVDLAERRASAHGWEQCECRCERCGHTWIGCFERPVEALECPKGCGEWGFPTMWRIGCMDDSTDTVLTCGECDRQSFAVLFHEGATYMVCRHCGARKPFTA